MGQRDDNTQNSLPSESARTPRLVALTDIDSARNKSNEALDLGIAIVWPKIDVESVLDGLGFVHESEQKADNRV